MVKKYDGTLQSLADKSHRPHHHPNEHTPEELKLIADMRKRNMNAGLGKTPSKTIYTIRNAIIPSFTKTRSNGGKTP